MTQLAPEKFIAPWQRRNSMVAAIFMCSSIFGSKAAAQHIYVDPRAEARVTVTDNANLTETNKVTDGVLNTAVGLNARVDGHRFRLALDYSLDHFLFFSDLTEDYRQNMFGTIDAEVWKDHLTVVGRASLRQQFLDQRGALSGSAANRTANRRLVQNYTGTGIFRTGITDFADLRVTYRFGLQRSPADDLTDDTLPINFSDAETQDITASIDSGDRFQSFQWRLFANSSRVRRSLEVNDFRNERAGGELTLKFNRYFQLLGNVNVSSNDFQSAVLSEDGFGWEAGFRWTPGRKLDVTVTHGREGNRQTWYATVQHFFTIRHEFTGSYTDTITANSIVQNDILGGLQFNPEEGIVNTERLPIDETDPTFSFSDVDFRRRIATGTFTVRQRRTKTYLTGFYEWRTFDDGSGTGEAWGTTLGTDHEINERTSLSARLSFRQSIFEGGARVDSFAVGNISWLTNIHKNLEFAVSFDHSTRVSSVDGEDLQENALTFYLRGIF